MLRQMFTLIELLVVFVIIAILVSILMPALAYARRQHTWQVACVSNMKQMGQALYMFSADNRDQMPKGDTSGAIYETLEEEGYLETREILSCPANPVEEVSFDKRDGVSYLIDPTMPQDRHPKRAVMADDPGKENHIGGVNVLFADGHVEFTDPMGNPYDIDHDFFHAASLEHRENAWIRWETEWYALEFDGDGGYVEIGEMLIPTDGDFTLALWMTVDGGVEDGDDRVVFQAGANDDDERLYFYSNTTFGDAEDELRFWDADLEQTVYGEDLRGEGWRHVVCLRDGEDWALYVDGDEIDTDVGSGDLSPTSNTFFGGGEPDGRWHWGKIGELRIYGEAISERDIQALYSGENISGNLAGHWPMNEGEGGLVNDRSGNDNHGSLYPIIPEINWEPSGRGDYIFYLDDYVDTQNWPTDMEYEHETTGNYSYVGGGYYGRFPDNLYIEVPDDVGVGPEDADAFEEYIAAHPITITDPDIPAPEWIELDGTFRELQD